MEGMKLVTPAGAADKDSGSAPPPKKISVESTGPNWVQRSVTSRGTSVAPSIGKGVPGGRTCAIELEAITRITIPGFHMASILQEKGPAPEREPLVQTLADRPRS